MQETEFEQRDPIPVPGENTSPISRVSVNSGTAEGKVAVSDALNIDTLDTTTQMFRSLYNQWDGRTAKTVSCEFF